MFGKFSIIPNRQLTRADIKDASDADMSQPEWLTKCGGCHTGGGISEYDLRGHRFLSSEAKPSGPLDPSYTIRDRETGPDNPMGLAKKRRCGSGLLFMSCSQSNRGERKKEMSAGDFRWANNATLVDTRIVVRQPNGAFTYNRGAFNA